VNQVIILGSGPAGLTAALYAGRAGLQPLVLEGPTPGGQLVKTSLVENWPGTPSIMGVELIMNMKAHAEKQGARCINQTAVRLEPQAHSCTIHTNKEVLYAHTVVIAVGSAPRKLNCPGEEEYWGKGVTVCAICDAALYKDLPVFVVGGGNTAMQDALFMTALTNNITIVHALDNFTASTELQKQVLKHPHITILYNSVVKEITGDNSRVTQVLVKNNQTGKEQKVSTAAVFLAIGSSPNTAFLQETLELSPSGHIKTVNGTQVTRYQNIFACGDVAENIYYKQAITAAASGCSAALDAQRYLEQHAQP